MISDPHHLPRWWPNTARVESVSGKGGRISWTQVFETKDGRGVRADFRAVTSTQPERFAFEQQVEGTPFERILRGSTMEVLLEDGGEGVGETARPRCPWPTPSGCAACPGSDRRWCGGPAGGS